ncbi:hypothetical protein L9F63_002791 [Diploptera punctata]|uniref:Mif2/CENP-C cupin domain-containing protein n=1 Tax=Diploptera punctata TaxID=6984 RepID=A0AAD7ZRK0_DIPPU|nr:hypothetical protein L9F63_002791 [Diploptera punctata]
MSSSRNLLIDKTSLLGSSSDSSITTIFYSSDSNESVDIVQDFAKRNNIQSKIGKGSHSKLVSGNQLYEGIKTKMEKTKRNELVSSTPLHGSVKGEIEKPVHNKLSSKIPQHGVIKTGKWPSPIAVLHSSFTVKRRPNNKNGQQSRMQKRVKHLNTNKDKMIYPPPLLKRPQNNNIQQPEVIEENSELRILRRSTRPSIVNENLNKNNKGRLKTDSEQSAHAVNREYKRLKQNIPEKINNDIREAKDDEEDESAEKTIIGGNTNKMIRSKINSPVKIGKGSSEEVQSPTRRSKRNRIAGIYDSDDEEDESAEKTIIGGNTNKVIKSKINSPVKVGKGSSEEVQSPTRRSKRNMKAGLCDDDREEDESAGITIVDGNKNKIDSPVKGRKHPSEEVQSQTRKRNRKAALLDDGTEDSEKSEANTNNKRRKATNNTYQTTSKARQKRKSNVTGNENGLRRSERTRIKPVSYWKGERVKYEIGMDNCFKVIGVNPGHFANYVPKMPQRKISKKKSDFIFSHLISNNDGIEKNMVLIPFHGFEKKIECFSTLRFDGDITEEPDQKIKQYTSLQIPGIEAGYLVFGPLSCLNGSMNNDEQLVMAIITGTVSVTVNKTKKTLNRGEFFCLVLGVDYQIQNITKTDVVLSYTWIVK